MKLSTALNHYKRLRTRLLDIENQARMYSWSHEEIMERHGIQIHDDPAWKRCPAWVRMKLQAISDLLHEQRYHAPRENFVVWQLYEDGKRVESNDVKDWSNVTGQHEWVKSGKLFSGGGPVKGGTDA